jgi:sentrin-specific protease 7
MFSTFFYTRLITLPGGKSGFNYSAVERWTLGVDIFSYKYIVVPINEE